MDELDSLGKVERLKDALTLGRKYGLSTIAAIQTLSQLKDTYGENDSKTLIGNFSSKIVLAQADFDTADYFSKTLGGFEEKLYIQKVSTSAGSSSSGGSSNRSMDVNENMDRNILLVTPTQLTALEKLTGYALLAGMSTNGIQNVLKFKLNVTDLEQISEPFVKRGEPAKETAIDTTKKVAKRFLPKDIIELTPQRTETIAKIVYMTIATAIIGAAAILIYILMT
jgi:type IV secretory pathway TraG/TraD family ATPase VirD4